MSVDDGDFTASRETNSRRGRPRGYAPWAPQRPTRRLLAQVGEVLGQYKDYLPLTVRQIFYRLVGAFSYEKTELAYGRLCEALVRARRARMIDFDTIRDDGVSVTQERWYANQQDFLEEYARAARGYKRDRQQGQRYQVELWSEAAGMLPQLARVAHDYSVPVYSSSGFVSLTAVRSIVERARDFTVPLVMLHVGDFDPSGESIFEAMAADAQAFIEEDRILASQRVIAVRVALTAEQVVSFDLPTAPAKLSDSRSARWRGETCQLEALAPDDLAVIVDDAIVRWLDADLVDAQIAHERTDQTALLRALNPGDSVDG